MARSLHLSLARFLPRIGAVGGLVLRFQSRKVGFSAIEVMIILAFLCILAAIAVPNFVEMQYRAKRAEVPSSVDGIKFALLAYESSNGRLLSELEPRPDSQPGKNMRAWRTGSKFDELGWAPEGDVRGSYSIRSEGKDFHITGYCDVDGDSIQAVYMATRDSNAVQTSATTTY